jgi:glycosyltransferase involved in cell wall biosynthesis
MRVYLNFVPQKGPYGGANAFLRTLMVSLGAHNVSFTDDERADVDVALVNALTGGMTLQRVQALAERGIPIVHRKTGFRGRGVAELRAEVDGAVVGDLRQIAFTPFVDHSIFQSAYSRDVFTAAGFSGPFDILPNGVDETVFNATGASRALLARTRPRSTWRAGDRLEVVISTWSTDDSKGFPHYRALDTELRGRRDVRVTLVGRVPEGTRFRSIRVLRPRAGDRLASLLRRHHVLLQLTEHESCSNALIEGLNCGLPAIYLDSGANREVADRYGVDWRGSLDDALERLLPDYERIVAELPSNPYRSATSRFAPESR